MTLVKFLNQFHHQILGPVQGPKVVFLHGLMGSGANWRKITAQLQNAYHILVFDQRGHGRSFHPESGYAPEDYADDLAHILDDLSWEKVILVWHSMGGRNALNFAFRWPHRVSKLVLEDISPGLAEQATSYIEGLLKLVPSPFASRAEAKIFLLEEFPAHLAGNPRAEQLAQYFYSNIEEKSNGQADWRFSKSGVLASLREGRSQERWSELQTLTMPVLVVRGANSPDLSRQDFDRMLQLNSKVHGVEIPDAGHWVHSDQPELFLRELELFFEA